MTASELLAELRDSGVTLTTYDGRLRYAGPPAIITPRLGALLSVHKAEIMALLAAGELQGMQRSAEISAAGSLQGQVLESQGLDCPLQGMQRFPRVRAGGDKVACEGTKCRDEGEILSASPAEDFQNLSGEELNPAEIVPAGSLRISASPAAPRSAEIGDWPIPWRQAWADRAERLQQEGADWRDAERAAYAEVRAMREAGLPPPDPDPAVAEALRAECERHRHEQPEGLRPAGEPTLPDDPLLAWLDRGVTREQLEPRPLSGDRPGFECRNPYCLRKGRWWRSVYGVTRCLNCRPPSSPELVAEVGGEPPPDPDVAGALGAVGGEPPPDPDVAGALGAEVERRIPGF